MADVCELESNLDLYALFDLWHIELDCLHQVSRDEWRSCCAFHGGDGDNALRIRYRRGRWWLNCYSHNCINSSLVDVGVSLGKSFTDVMRDYEQCQGVSVANVRRGVPRIDTVRSDALPDNVMDRYEYSIHKSYVNLGYDRDTLLNVFGYRYCNDPFDPLYGRVVYPIRDKRGVIRSIQGRRTPTCGDATKYMFLPGYNAKHLLYGAYAMRDMIRRSRYIIVAESPKSTLRGYQLGYPVLSLMGIRYTDAQVHAIASYGRRVILAADNDAPGKNGTRAGIDGANELADELRRYVRVDVRICPRVGADISDYRTRGEWRDILGV